MMDDDRRTDVPDPPVAACTCPDPLRAVDYDCPVHGVDALLGVPLDPPDHDE